MVAFLIGVIAVLLLVIRQQRRAITHLLTESAKREAVEPVPADPLLTAFEQLEVRAYLRLAREACRQEGHEWVTIFGQSPRCARCGDQL